MPPKAKPAKAAKAEAGITIQGYCDAMKGVSIMVRARSRGDPAIQHGMLFPSLLITPRPCSSKPPQNELTGKVVKRGEAALHVWSHSMQGEDEREDVFKSGCAANLLLLVDRGDAEERFGCMGCLSALAASEKHIAEIINNKVGQGSSRLHTCRHAVIAAHGP